MSFARHWLLMEVCGVGTGLIVLFVAALVIQIWAPTISDVWGAFIGGTAGLSGYCIGAISYLVAAFK